MLKCSLIAETTDSIEKPGYSMQFVVKFTQRLIAADYPNLNVPMAGSWSIAPGRNSTVSSPCILQNIQQHFFLHLLPLKIKFITLWCSVTLIYSLYCMNGVLLSSFLRCDIFSPSIFAHTVDVYGELIVNSTRGSVGVQGFRPGKRLDPRRNSLRVSQVNILEGEKKSSCICLYCLIITWKNNL